MRKMGVGKGFLSNTLFPAGIRPFPGKWPTRWSVKMSLRDGRSFEYFGKPSKEIALKVAKVARGQAGKIQIFELDRAGWIAGATGSFTGSVIGFPRRTTTHTSRLSFYHPNADLGGVFSWIFHPFWRKRIKVGEKIYTTYFTDERLSKEQLSQFKSWVTSSGVLNG